VNPQELAGGPMIHEHGGNAAAITPRGKQGDVDFGAVCLPTAKKLYADA
jgi:hypothetical protein